MNSPKIPTKNPSPNLDLAAQLNHIGLRVAAQGLDDLLARASTQPWSPRQLLEEIARSETEDRARRSLERRLAQARLGRFKPLADFDWHWPKKIDRPLIERALTLDFLASGRNLILCGTNGLGKTLIAKNIAHAPCSPATRYCFAPPPICSPILMAIPPAYVAVSSASTPVPLCWSLTNVDTWLTTPTPPTCSLK